MFRFIKSLTRYFSSTTEYNINRKTIRFILAVSAEHRKYNNTLYNNFYFIQTCGGKTRTEMSDSLDRILSEQRPEKTCRKKNPVGKKTAWQGIWVGYIWLMLWKAHPTKVTRLEGLCPYLLNRKFEIIIQNENKLKSRALQNSNCHQ